MKRCYCPSLESLEGRRLLVATGVTFSLSPPKLGTQFQADLTYISSPNYSIASTGWTEVISYGGFTTPPVGLSDGYMSTQVVSSVPGVYVITAVTTYTSSNPSVGPPGQTTVSGTITIPAPDGVTKGGGVGGQAPVDTAIQMTDPVTAGGQPIGPDFIGNIQEDILPFIWWDGTDGGDSGWGPPAPSPQFNFRNGQINDQFQFFADPATWASIPVGSVLCTFTQNLRFYWTMTTTAGDQPFYAPLPSLTWTWTKVSATAWEVD